MVNIIKRSSWLWLLLVCGQVQAKAPLQSELVKQREWLRAEHQLIAGPVMLRELSSESHSEGYYPSATVTAAGLHLRKIADYSRTLTAQFLFDILQQKIARYGFVSEYQCKAQICGDIRGWQALTDPLLDGESGTQFYILAKAPAAIGMGYVALHVADLDGQPRVVADMIMADTSLRHMLDMVLFNEVFNYKAEQLVTGSTLYFALDSSIPLAGSDATLRHMAAQLQADPQQHFVVVGHADTSGNELYNQSLSLARAEQVRKQLITQHGVDARQLSAAGAGITGSDASFRKTVLVAAN
ncbi:OmpA family protein [Rheinheimera pacifica]|uniref:OmpA family protein n=1 Tax=Rheinheimera pacifica TaxID=173990 RepID=A0A1H6KYY8_9GAMM|nr:OmpA family protein [Rheinheimera pacifica]SEH81186.1 OmpA family protein [Rheinheimera pacifica]